MLVSLLMADAWRYKVAEKGIEINSTVSVDTYRYHLLSIL